MSNSGRGMKAWPSKIAVRMRGEFFSRQATSGPAPPSKEVESRSTTPEGAMAISAPHLPWSRLRAKLFLLGSKVRATLRWIKYVVLYEDWLDYVVHKVERRRGVLVELTARERRWPLIFLWPKAFKLLGRRGEPRRRA